MASQQDELETFYNSVERMSSDLELRIDTSASVKSRFTDILKKGEETPKTMKEQEQCITEQHHDGIDVGQQVRQVREQMQHLELDLMETRRLLVQAQRETDILTHELDEMNRLSREKDTRANNLAEELGAAKAWQTQLEGRMQAKIKKLKAEKMYLKDFYQQEISVLQKSNEKVIMYTDNQKSTNHYLSEQLHHAMHELEEATDKVSSLQTDLQARNEVIQATNEALLVKESEVTRLKTRISGYERKAGVKKLQNPLESFPQRLAVLNVQQFSPHLRTSGSKYRTIRRSISASDISMKEDTDSQHFSPSMLDDLEHKLPEHEVLRSFDRLRATTDDPEESSFNPLAYTVDENAVDSSSDNDDFGTLSRMLRYINANMKTSETSLAQTSSNITTAETK